MSALALPVLPRFYRLWRAGFAFPAAIPPFFAEAGSFFEREVQQMVNSAIQAELLKELERLSETNQKLVLGYARALSAMRETATAEAKAAPRSVMHLFGVLSHEEAEKMRKDIEEGCEQIDPNGW